MRPPIDPEADRPQPAAAPTAGERDQQELDLLARARNGDPVAFQTLLRPHLPALLGLARRCCSDPHWAEDLVQEVLLRAFRALPSFRGEAGLRTWLFRILVRLAGEPGRWRRGTPTVPLEVDVPDTLPDAAVQGAMTRELQARLAEAMERLTNLQRTALHLRASEGLDYRAIATVLGVTDVAARMHVLAARRKVMERLQEYLEP
ncbi:MAG: sigma-70 family RNA polymerase sigma factor [Planctomycetes bacterium]|nr:sigma-70 family RNA polymerase sigma factor [Planctomycetota bacterium]